MAKRASSRKKRGVKIRRKRLVKAGRKGKKPKSTKVVYHSTKEIKVERALIENFIGLQKVMVNLSGKFEDLSSQISKLLDLFEISAKALAKKDFSSGNLEAKRVMEKLDNLSQQAGLIGKGLALIHEVGTENERPIIPLTPRGNVQPASFSSSASPSFQPGARATRAYSQTQPQQQKMTKEVGEFQKSKETEDIGASATAENRGFKEDSNVGTNI